MRLGVLVWPPPLSALGATAGLAGQKQTGEESQEKDIKAAQWREVPVRVCLALNLQRPEMYR